MNKKLINALLFGSLMVGSVGSFTSCKDYDDDIDGLNKTTGDLKSQIEQLNSSLASNKATAEQAEANAQKAIAAAAAAQKAGDDAMAAAKAADANAQAALAAASQAKADAIAEILKQLEPLQGNVAENSEAIKGLLSRVAAIEGNIAAIQKTIEGLDLDAINKKIDEVEKLAQATETQLAAMKGYGDRLAALETANTEAAKLIQTNKEDIAALTASLETLKGEVAKCASAADLKDLQDKFNAIEGDIFAKLPSQISTYISGRLTSVTLVPDLYVGGIPTISFETARYQKMKFDEKTGTWVADKDSNKKDIFVQTSNTATTARYRLNPAAVSLNDIDAENISYVHNIATVRSRAGENQIVKPAAASIKDGILSVQVTKANVNANLNVPNDKNTDQKYTVALQVPIAKAHLFEGEENASVFSEYTMIEENIFTPELRFTEGTVTQYRNDASWKKWFPNGHLATEDQCYSSATDYIAQSVVYNAEYDLDNLVAGCKIWDATNHAYMTKEQLEDYGFDIVYSIVDRDFLINGKGEVLNLKEGDKVPADATNQQLFAKIEGSILTPQTPNGETGNQAIIGRTPVISAMMIDTKNANNYVDLGYFKVQFSQVKMDPITIDFMPFVSDFDCENGDKMMLNITWRQFQETVLEKIPENGMSENDFYAIYTEVNVSWLDNSNKKQWQHAGKPGISASINKPQTSTTIFSWTVDKALMNLAFDKSQQFKAVLTFVDPLKLHPNITVNLDWTINFPKAGDAKLGVTDKTYWNDEVMKVVCQPMPANWDATMPTVSYNTNIFQGRILPYTTGILACNTFSPRYNTEKVKNAEGKEVYKYAQGGYLVYNGTEWISGNNDKTLDVDFRISPEDPVGQELASNGGDVVIDWCQFILGGYDKYKNPSNVFAQSTLRVLPILTVNSGNAGKLIDNSREQTVEIKPLLKDAYGNLVSNAASAKDPAQKYWGYYVCQSFVYDNANIMVTSDNKGSNPKSLEYYNMTATVDETSNKLTYTNAGAAVQNTLYLQIPVSVKHKYGVVKGFFYVEVAVNPNAK